MSEFLLHLQDFRPLDQRQSLKGAIPTSPTVRDYVRIKTWCCRAGHPSRFALL